MKNLSLLGLVLALLAGCASPQMKSTPFYEGNDKDAYTGAVEDRVNLWPVAYWREPVGSVAWPLLSFSDDQLALRPLYSQYRQEGKAGGWDEFNLCWPLAQADLRDNDYRVFPVYWGGTTNRSYECVFPVWFNGRQKDGAEGYNALFPLWIANWEAGESSLKVAAGLAGGRTRTSGYASHWCFPLWYWNNKGVLATPLYGQTPDSYWCFPLWYRDADTFVSLPVSWTGDGKEGGWASPALLSWGGWKRDGSYDAEVCLGTLGMERRTSRFRESTNFYHDAWCGPLWSRTATQRFKGGACRRTSTHRLLMGLLSKFNWRDEDLSEAYVLPLFHWKNDGTFYTPLGGRNIPADGQTNTLYTVLAGTRRGREEGGWVFPLWSHEKQADFDIQAARIESPRLPDDIKVWFRESTNAENKVTLMREGTYFGASDKSTWFLLSDDDTHVRGYTLDVRTYTPTNAYRMTWSRKRGNELVFNIRERREALFNSETREKAEDDETDETSLLVWLYESNGTRDRMTGDVYRHRRMLWRLWDWERTNDDVSLDVFPGFTYDAKADGFVKTSLLWRLFRYENDPKAGVSADLLFLPVWRP